MNANSVRWFASAAGKYYYTQDASGSGSTLKPGDEGRAERLLEGWDIGYCGFYVELDCECYGYG